MLKITILIFTVCLFASISTSQVSKQIHAGAIVDVEKGSVRDNVLIRIENDLIVSVDDFKRELVSADVIDLSNKTVLPGLIDCHTHLASNSYDKSIDIYSAPAPFFGVISAVNAKKTLDAGFTTIRNLGGFHYSGVATRDAIKRGIIPGPRMYVSGPYITMTGGHGALANWLTPQMALAQDVDGVADGEVEVRKEVRKQIKHGVNVIKIMATGGFGTFGSKPGAASYTEAEIAAAVDEARKNGLKVAAHAHGSEGIMNAIRAGVASIEHGSFLNDQSLQMMKNKKVFLVMDVLGAHYDLIESNLDFEDKAKGLTNRQMYDSFVKNFKAASDAGVLMAFGSDASVFPHGRNAEQFELMTKAGMKRAAAIRMATINAAKLLGIEKHAGSIEVGKWADLIAVKGNPLKNIKLLEEVVFVMKAGQVYKGE